MMAKWWTEKVPRMLLFYAFMFGVIMGFGCYRWGHYFWPAFFTLMIDR